MEADPRVNASNVDRSIESCDGSIGACTSGDFIPSVRILLEKRYALAISVCLIVLSVGLSISTVLFVYLCFIYPSAANIILPLIFAPLAAAALPYGKKALEKISDKSSALKAQNTTE